MMQSNLDALYDGIKSMKYTKLVETNLLKSTQNITKMIFLKIYLPHPHICIRVNNGTILKGKSNSHSHAKI